MSEKFLQELTRYLSPLDENERKEIVDFYRERFQTAMLYEGKTEQEVIDELEQPQDIARNVLREYGYRPVPKTDASSKVVTEEKTFNFVKIFFVLVFDLLVVTWMVPALFGILVSLFGSWWGFLFTMQMPVDFGALSVYYAMLVAGLLFLWFLLILWFYDVLAGFLIWLVRLHIDVFHLQNGKQVIRFLNRFKVSRILQKNPPVHRLKNTLKSLSAILVIVGGIGTLWLGGQLFAAQDHAMEIYRESFETTSDTSWSIIANMDVGDLNIVYHDLDTIVVDGEIIDRVETAIEIDAVSNTITIDNEFTFPRFTFNFFGALWWDQGALTIYLPQDMVLTSLEMDSTNSALTINDVIIGTASVSTTNGSFNSTRVIFNEDAVFQSTNGTVTLRNVHADQLSLKTTNGQIDIRNSNLLTLETQTTNGKIVIRDLNTVEQNGVQLNATSTNGTINLVNVYTARVWLKTTNGNIDYDNADRDYYLESVEGTTTNGSVNIQVPRN